MTQAPLINSEDEYKYKTRDVKAVKFLKILVVLASIYTLYFAQSIIIPLLFSALIALLLSPLVRKLKKLYVPRSISAIVLLAALVAPFSLLTIELVEPVERWMKFLPKFSVQVTQRIEEISSAFDEEKKMAIEAQKKEPEGFFSRWFSSKEEIPIVTKSENAVEAKIKQGSLDMLVTMLAAAPMFLAQIFGCMILILFLLIYGPPIFSVLINDFPIVKNKKKADLLVKSTQQELSKYIMTISVVNFCLGAATAGGLALFGVQDYLLWGVIVGLLNFVPYVGSIISVSILCVVGVVQFGVTAVALLPSGIFLALNILESQFITPAVLGNSMRVNPLVIILWLSVSGWLWGIFGVLLAVPLLVCIKLALEQMEVLPHWLSLIEASETDLKT